MKSVLWLWFILCALLVPSLSAQDKAAAKLFARVDGSTVRLAIQVDVTKGWHAYNGPTLADAGEDGAIVAPTKLEITGLDATFGPWRFPEPAVEMQDFGTPLKTFVQRGTFTIYRKGTLAGGAKLEGLKVALKGQVCSEDAEAVCEPFEFMLTPQSSGGDAHFAAFPSDLAATSELAASQKDAPTAAVNDAEESEEAGAEKSLAAFLLSAVVWGLITLLMPCTYPMIPITISFFTKQATARHTSTLPLSLAYGAGIVLIFVLIGLALGPLIIEFATHPVTNLVIAALFLFFALTLFGVLNLQPPAFLMGVAGSASQRGGLIGVFLMGATLVVTSFTCTAPFVGTLLSTGASQGNMGRIVLGMGVFGATIALPFVWLSMVPAKVKSLPKSGEWMHSLKVWLGFIEVAAALKFISNADLVWDWQWLSRELYLCLWAAIFLAAAAYLFAWIRLRDEFGTEEPPSIGGRRMVAGVGTLLFAAYCAFGALDQRMDPIMTALIPPYSSRLGTSDVHTSASSTHASGHIIIKDDFDAALARAKAEKKLLLANFTGFSCVNCRKMEESLFPKPIVSQALREGFIEARLHTDGGPSLERNKALQQEYTRSIANPIYVVIDPTTKKMLRRKGGLIAEKKFLEFLRG